MLTVLNDALRDKGTAFTEADRKARLVPFLSAHQARNGKTFYELFPRDE